MLWLDASPRRPARKRSRSTARPARPRRARPPAKNSKRPATPPPPRRSVLRWSLRPKSTRKATERERERERGLLSEVRPFRNYNFVRLDLFSHKDTAQSGPIEDRGRIGLAISWKRSTRADDPEYDSPGTFWKKSSETPCLHTFTIRYSEGTVGDTRSPPLVLLHARRAYARTARAFSSSSSSSSLSLSLSLSSCDFLADTKPRSRHSQVKRAHLAQNFQPMLYPSSTHLFSPSHEPRSSFDSCLIRAYYMCFRQYRTQPRKGRKNQSGAAKCWAPPPHTPRSTARGRRNSARSGSYCRPAPHPSPPWREGTSTGG